MKYTILINQAGIVDADLHTKTDVVDWSLLDYIFAFQQSPTALFHENKVWINYSHLISEMPLLGLNAKNSVANRVKKVRDLGLIDTYQSPIDQKLYARTTKLYYDITQFKGEPRIKKENTTVPTQEHPVPTQEHPVPVEVHILDNHLSVNHLTQKTLSPASEETIIFSQELPVQEPAKIIEKELPPPSANRPTFDREIENLTAIAVLNYWAGMLITLPIEEAEAFILHYKGQGWYTNQGAPISSWRAYALKWHQSYLKHKAQKQNEAAKKPARSSKSKQDFSNIPDYSFTAEELAEREKNRNAINVPVTGLLGFNGGV